MHEIVTAGFDGFIFMIIFLGVFWMIKNAVSNIKDVGTGKDASQLRDYGHDNQSAHNDMDESLKQFFEQLAETSQNKPSQPAAPAYQPPKTTPTYQQPRASRPAPAYQPPAPRSTPAPKPAYTSAQQAHKPAPAPRYDQTQTVEHAVARMQKISDRYTKKKIDQKAFQSAAQTMVSQSLPSMKGFIIPSQRVASSASHTREARRPIINFDFKNRKELRKAILSREILGPPKAFDKK